MWAWLSFKENPAASPCMKQRVEDAYSWGCAGRLPSHYQEFIELQTQIGLFGDGPQNTSKNI